MQMAAKMSYNPAKVLGIPKGTLDEGKIQERLNIQFLTEKLFTQTNKI